jgi:isopentenyl-diphosphate delta-isomerase type 2/3-hydroxy-3-methylglutaryl CoA synthase
MELSRLYDERVRNDPGIERRLRRSIEATGQVSFRFPEPWEDSATIAAQSAYGLLARHREKLSGLRYLATGTETTVDQSKPMAAYVEGMLQKAGLEVPESLMTFQSQHACAGGTVALMSIAGMIAAAPGRAESGLVISSDIARYDAPSTAEITQGAGAISLLVENNPSLLELDLETQGLCSRDVDDFFRPNGSITAKVKGPYSVQCYNEALDSAFHDHCSRRGESPEDVLHGTDMFIFHVPFKRMALTAVKRLISHHVGIHGAELQEFVDARGYEASLEPNTVVGNLYTASALLAMVYHLKERHETFGDAIVGKTFMLASYGSGNTMIIVSGRVAPEAPRIIRSWDLDSVLSSAAPATFDRYNTWLGAPHSSPGDIGRRKSEHLDICIDSDRYSVENGTTMMDHVRLVHRALPEVNAGEVALSAKFLDRPVRLPLFISSMTGGSTEAYRMNKDLARVAQEAGIPVGMGSIRILFRNPEVIDHFRLKAIATDVPVFANIGGVQLRAGGHGPLVELLRRLEVDAVAVHLNPGQEMSQPEGDREFQGVLDGIRSLCRESPVPVIVKETGSGIAPDETARLIDAGARYVDVAGSGGTNWMTVEGFRLDGPERDAVAQFAGWGVPTAAILRSLQRSDRDFGDAVLASGGLRDGMDVAKSLALGAVAVGMALPFIRAVAADGVHGGMQFIDGIASVLRTVMVLTGCVTVDQLRSVPVLTTPHLDHMVAGLVGLHRL